MDKDNDQIQREKLIWCIRHLLYNKELQITNDRLRERLHDLITRLLDCDPARDPRDWRREARSTLQAIQGDVFGQFVEVAQRPMTSGTKLNRKERDLLEQRTFVMDRLQRLLDPTHAIEQITTAAEVLVVSAEEEVKRLSVVMGKLRRLMVMLEGPEAANACFKELASAVKFVSPQEINKSGALLSEEVTMPQRQESKLALAVEWLAGRVSESLAKVRSRNAGRLVAHRLKDLAGTTNGTSTLEALRLQALKYSTDESLPKGRSDLVKFALRVWRWREVSPDPNEQPQVPQR